MCREAGRNRLAQVDGNLNNMRVGGPREKYGLAGVVESRKNCMICGSWDYIEKTRMIMKAEDELHIARSRNSFFAWTPVERLDASSFYFHKGAQLEAIEAS
jgi:hypothetical protein